MLSSYEPKFDGGESADISPDLCAEAHGALDHGGRSACAARCPGLPRGCCSFGNLAIPFGGACCAGGSELRGGRVRLASAEPRLREAMPQSGGRNRSPTRAALGVRASVGLDEPAMTSDRAVVNDGVVKTAFPLRLQHRSDRHAGLRDDCGRFGWLDDHRSGVSLRMFTPGSSFPSSACLRFAPEDAEFRDGPGWDHQS